MAERVDVPFDLAWEACGLVIRYSGNLMASDVLACHERIAADPRFDDLRFAIVDARSVQALTATSAEIELIEAFLQGPAMTNPAISAVFVATEPSVLAALGTYNAISDRAYRITVCDSLTEARAQLGARPAQPRSS
jgi:hypothetical protein